MGGLEKEGGTHIQFNLGKFSNNSIYVRAEHKWTIIQQWIFLSTRVMKMQITQDCLGIKEKASALTLIFLFPLTDNISLLTQEAPSDKWMVH
jgi:hypothetical protein